MSSSGSIPRLHPSHQGSDSAQQGPALVGVEDLNPPSWADARTQAGQAGTRQLVGGLIRTVTLIAGWAWRSSPRLTLAALAVYAGSGVAGALGLLATAHVLSDLLSAGPAPHRLTACTASKLIA
ncbi:hypothetical protein ACFWY5_57250 [Nonomuraea sp. NPDC059007]|uniref:hypothetical protein n=1 Tax=Nonomuraea sp. NPDC059007 TaxID=3346692 RepID=UPI003693A219